jgi:glycosyltransferase involved in cell wall biosynthesis
LKDLNWCDIILISNILKFGGPYTARVCGIAREMGKFVHFDTDDLLTDLYDEHKLFGVYKDNQLDEITKFVYANSQLVTVTQRKFAKRIIPYVPSILATIPNQLDYKLPCWNAKKVDLKYTRIGWALGIHHAPDVKEFMSVPHLVNQKVGRENVKFDFYGEPPPDPNAPKDDWQGKVWGEYKASFFKGFKGQPNYQIYYAMPPDHYGIYYANMDICIAPLKMNNFNDSKSSVKVAEASMYKNPLVASNVGCYDEDIINGETGYLIDPGAPKTEWIRILSKLCKDKKHRIELGQNLYNRVRNKYDARKNSIDRIHLYYKAMQDLGYKPQ